MADLNISSKVIEECMDNNINLIDKNLSSSMLFYSCNRQRLALGNRYLPRLFISFYLKWF